MFFAAACGGSEESRSKARQESERENGLSAATPAQAANTLESVVIDPARALPAETVPLETLPLAALFEARPVEPPEGARRMRPLLDPAADGWGDERVAARVERELPALIERALAPDDGGGLEVAADLRGLLPLPDAAHAHGPRVTAEVVGYVLDGARLDCTVRVGVSALDREARGPADPVLQAAAEEPAVALGAWEVARTLATRWELDGDDLRLRSVADATEQPEPRAVRAAGALFREHTRAVFGVDAEFEEQFLRSPEAYFFHSDRLTGYDVMGHHGMAVADLDGDGWEDLYLCMVTGLPNRLYLRRPDGSLREAGAELGVNYLDVSRSALIVDLDGDGRRDLLVAVGSAVLIHWGEADALSKPTRLQPTSTEEVYGMSVGDVDQDGDLDLFVCRYNAQGAMAGNPTPYHDARNGAPNHLWRNAGERRFEDATAEVGLDVGNTRFSFASAFEDLDDDGDLDLYVVNDFGPNHLWRNDGGRFTDIAGEVGAADMAAGMGVAVGDVDGDCDPDLYVSNIYSAVGKRHVSQGQRFLRGRPEEVLAVYAHHVKGNSLLENLGPDGWRDRGPRSGAERGGWAWGAQFFDLENDGDLDLYSPNGFVRRRGEGSVDEPFWRLAVSRSGVGPEMSADYRDAWELMRFEAFEVGRGWHGEERNVLLVGDGRGEFAEASGISGADHDDESRCVVPVDWDRDGFVDLMVKNRNAPRVRFLRNQGDSRRERAWIIVELVGRAPNPDAVGARVVVRSATGAVCRSLRVGDGYLAQTPGQLHFGLGGDADVESIEVRWPDGTREVHEGPFATARAWRIAQGAERPLERPWQRVQALADAVDEPLVERAGISGRTVLVDKLPLAPLTLPGFGGGQRMVGHLAGRPVLVTLWQSGDAASEGQLVRLSRAAAALDAAGLAVVPLALDSGASLAGARRTSEKLGFREAGFVDGWTRQALEVLLLEVYHRPETNPVPTSLLIDRAGQVCVVYQGPFEVERMLADLAQVEQMDPRLGTCARLMAGRWENRPRRDLNTLQKVFSGLGYQEFAGYYAQFLSR